MTRIGCVCDSRLDGSPLVKGEPFVRGRDCPQCWAFWHDPAVNAARGGTGIVAVSGATGKGRVVLPVRPTPCIHEGPVVEWCSGCPKSQQDRHVRHCLYDGHEFDRCARNHPDPKPDVRNCSACPNYAGPPPPAKVGPPPDALPPLTRTSIPGNLLAHSAAGHQFNPGIIRWRGRLLMAYRTDRAKSRIHLCELSEPGFTPGPSVTLDLSHREAASGQEDPRLFVHGGRLHVAFIGLSGTHGPASQLYAVLRDNLTVERVYYPKFDHRPQWEKNWQFFDHGGELFAAYCMDPAHVVYKIDGDSAYPAHGTPNPFPWDGGARRGGTPPVRVGGEYVSWFHGVKNIDGLTTYSVGVYAFEAKPPFRVTRQTEHPLIWGGHLTVPPGLGKAVVFPCGAVLEDGKWIVSYGVHDERCEVGEWDAAAVDAAMLPAELRAAIDATASLPGWCSPEKARRLASLILAERPALVVEVGVFGGRSLLPMAMAVKHLGQGVVYAVDPWDTAAATEGEQQRESDREWWAKEDLGGAFRAFAEAVVSRNLSGVVQVLRKRASDAVELFAPGSIDLFHLDGNHSPEITRCDLEAYLPRVRTGGIVVVDDTDDERRDAWLPTLEAAATLEHDGGTYRVYRR